MRERRESRPERSRTRVRTTSERMLKCLNGRLREGIYSRRCPGKFQGEKRVERWTPLSGHYSPRGLRRVSEDSTVLGLMCTGPVQGRMSTRRENRKRIVI